VLYTAVAVDKDLEKVGEMQEEAVGMRNCPDMLLAEESEDETWLEVVEAGILAVEKQLDISLRLLAPDSAPVMEWQKILSLRALVV
jgi:hypothetical protein